MNRMPCHISDGPEFEDDAVPGIDDLDDEDSIIISRLKSDLRSVKRSRDQLASMYADSERRLTAALNAIEAAFNAGYEAGWDLGAAHERGNKTEFDPRMAYIEWDQEKRTTA